MGTEGMGAMRVVKGWALCGALVGALAGGPVPAGAHEDHVAAPVEPASAAVNPYPLADLSAQFKVSFRPAAANKASAASVQTWTLSRRADRITFVKGAIEEIWTRDARGGIGLSRIFRDDKAVADYSMGELKALGVQPRWETLGTLFDEAAIRMLMPRGVSTRAGREVYRFTGKLGAEQVDLSWDATARLPVRLVRSGPAGRVSFELQATHDAAPAAWPIAGAGIDSFERIDAADFGDMESNLFVRKAYAYDVGLGWRTAHAH
jgi:hypothetical protein